MSKILNNIKPNFIYPHKKSIVHIEALTKKCTKSLGLEKTPVKDIFYYEMIDNACFDREKAERLFKYGKNMMIG